jgi:diguanylate cyclase (GGDEF)-like protein
MSDAGMADAVRNDAQSAARSKALPDVTTAIGVLWERFKGVAFDRLESVEAAVVAQLEGRLEAEQKRSAEREAHKLAGSVGTFGFAEGSRVARDIELLLQGPLGPAETLHLSDLSVALRRALERPGMNGEVTESPAAARTPQKQTARSGRDLRPLMLIIDADASFAGRVGAEAEARRMRHRIAGDAEEARAALGSEPPDVVVIDLQFGGGTERGLALIAEVARCAPRARTLVTSATGGYEERLEVARRGGRGFLQKPTAPARVVEAASELLGTADGAIRRVLVVDDDVTMLGVVVEHLRGPRLEVVTLDDPLRFWETLERTRPDVLLIDEHMPSLSGSELCAVLRGDPRWAGLPVLFITGSADVETVKRVFASGADDFVAKPFAGPELRTRIEGRLERQRLQRVLAEQDPLTGVANRRQANSALEQQVRSRQPMSVALVDIDGLRDIDTMHGDAAGDAALRRVARLLSEVIGADEIVGRWSGDTFVMGFSSGSDDAVRRLREALDRLRSEGVSSDDGRSMPVSFCAGIASYPGDGHDLRALFSGADQALAAAQREGAGIILPSGWSDRGRHVTEKVDVVLVEDDVALAGLLGHTLETRGHSTRVIADGGEAIEALCGASPRLQARVIILDVDLPGRDGFDVLRSLARDGVTERSRVVMLTVRATEPEVVRALELGAFDHIGKPFSVQILMQRLRRALGE